MITVSILCGGKSSRMQTEKGLVLYNGKPFIKHIIDAVLPISHHIQLITNGSDYNEFNYKIVNDIVENKGPIGGIYSALMNSESELNLVLSCDIPLISTAILSKLIENHKPNSEVSVFEVSGRIHPLIGIYSKKIIPVLKHSIDENQLKMMDFLDEIALQINSISGERSKQFQNINSVIELNQLKNI